MTNRQKKQKKAKNTTEAGVVPVTVIAIIIMLDSMADASSTTNACRIQSLTKILAYGLIVHKMQEVAVESAMMPNTAVSPAATKLR